MVTHAERDFGSSPRSSAILGGWLERRASDLVILTVLATLSVVPYVFRLGFYSDDWGFLSMLLNSPDQSLSGLIATQYSNDNLRMRPTQMVYQAVLFKAYGLRPLGYQLVNAAVLASVVLLLYSILREIGIPRTVARAVSTVYLLLPNYSTDRFWFAAFGYTLTAALFLLSTYASFRALRSDRSVFWFGLALLALTASLLGMEIFLPLTLAIPVGLWLQSRRFSPGAVGAPVGTLKTLLLLGAPIAIVAAIVSYKAENAVGAALPDLSYLIRLAIGSVAVNFGTYGIALPHTLAWSMRQLTLAAMVLPCILGVIVFLWLLRGEAPPDSRRFWIVLVIAGGLVFCLGTVIFVATPRVAFWSTGIGNRVWIAAALGAAAVLVGAAGWLTSRLSTGLHRRLFPALIATLCASCFAIDVALSAYWVDAWPHELEVLDKMQRVLPRPRSGTTLILYGACPYVGPAIVFESPWDFAGARKVLYRDFTLAGDVLDDTRPGRFGITEEGLWTRLYGESRFYRFGPDLLLFDYRAGEVRPLVDRASAVTGLSEPTGCPRGVEGGGTVSLPLDTWYAKTSVNLSRFWR
jgi:hypothetical protein